jgi:hypothetical protein
MVAKNLSLTAKSLSLTAKSLGAVYVKHLNLTVGAMEDT